MSVPFDPKGKLIRLLDVELEGPRGVLSRPTWALDTGSGRTIISLKLLVSLGDDPTLSTH